MRIELMTSFGHHHGPGVGALRRLLLTLLVFGFLVGLERGLDAHVRHARVRQLLAELEDLVGRDLLRGVRQEHRHEDLQLLALHAFVDAHGPNPALP